MPDHGPCARVSVSVRVEPVELGQKLPVSTAEVQDAATTLVKGGLDLSHVLEQTGCGLYVARLESVERVQVVGPALQQALVQDMARVSALHKAVGEVAMLLKGEFLSVLNLQRPKSAPTDND